MCISRELLATLRVVVARGVDETSAAALAQASSLGGPPLNARNEEAALGALVATLRSRLAKGRQSSVESDQYRILSALSALPHEGDGEVSHYRAALALMSRLETKQVLLAAIPVLEKAILVLRNDPASYLPPCDVH